MDNTLNDFTGHYEKWVKELGYTLTGEKDKHYKIEDTINLPTQEERRVVHKKILMDDAFWLTLPRLKGANEALRTLADMGNTLCIATIPYRFQPRFFDTKRIWIQKNFPSIDFSEFHFEKEKWKIQGDILIDDKPENIEKFPGITIKMFQPYNRTTKSDYTVKKWSEVPHIIEELINLEESV